LFSAAKGDGAERAHTAITVANRDFLIIGETPSFRG
jgi:hypothetical protein